nr:hypothetical protein [uncultured archaeon]
MRTLKKWWQIKLIIGNLANFIVEMLFEQELESECEQFGFVEFERQWSNGLF